MEEEKLDLKAAFALFKDEKHIALTVFLVAVLFVVAVNLVHIDSLASAFGNAFPLVLALLGSFEFGQVHFAHNLQASGRNRLIFVIAGSSLLEFVLGLEFGLVHLRIELFLILSLVAFLDVSFLELVRMSLFRRGLVGRLCGFWQLDFFIGFYFYRLAVLRSSFL